MTVWLSPWDSTATDWAGVQCLVLVVAAGFALWQVCEARRLRGRRRSPSWSSTLRCCAASKIHIVISNNGGTMARDVRLMFEPDLTSSFHSKENITSPRELKPLREGIASLPPGKRIDVLFDVFAQRDAAVYPDVYEVHVAFDAPALKDRLEDDSVLDLGIYRNVLHVNR